MSNLLSTVALPHYYFIPLVLLLLRNFPLSSPYPNLQRQPAQSSLNNFSKQNSKNVVDKYSNNFHDPDLDPVISSTQSSWSSFQPHANNNQPITQIQTSNLRPHSSGLSNSKVKKVYYPYETTPEVPKDQGYILAPGGSLSPGFAQGKPDEETEKHASGSLSGSGFSSSNRKLDFGSSSMLTFPEFLEFQPDKKRAKKSKNKDEQLIEFEMDNVFGGFYNPWGDTSDFGANLNSKLTSLQKGSPDSQRKEAQHPQYTSQAQSILTELRNEIKLLSEHRAAEIIRSQCGNACEYYPSSPVPDFLLDSRFDPFPVYYGFNVQLRNNIVVNPWSSMPLTNFYLPVGSGSFIRGFQLEEDSGSSSVQRLRVAVSGVYSLSTNIHFRVAEAQLEQIRLKHYIQISIYASDQIYTERRPSSKFYQSIPSAKHFSVFFSSLLYLKADQPLSVEVENLSKAKIVIGQDSSFSGHLVGS